MLQQPWFWKSSKICGSNRKKIQQIYDHNCTMVSVAARGKVSWVCDPSLLSYALKQPDMLRSPDYKHKCHAPFKCAPTVYFNHDL